MCISVALAFMTMSLLGMAGAIGLWPDPMRGVLKERTGLLEMVAISATEAITRGDEAAIEKLANDLANGSSLVRSVAVRRENAGMVYESPTHQQRWAGAPADGSTLTHARLRVFNADKVWGMIELAFDQPEASRILGVPVNPQMRGMLLTSLAAFLVYWAGAHLLLRKLASAQNVPDRIQHVFDAMTEAVVLLDDAERIVVANQAFWALSGRSADGMIGQTPDALRWGSGSAETTPESLPWRETLKDGVTRTRQRIFLRTDDASVRILSVATAAITGSKGKHMGVLLTLDDITIMEEQTAENAALLAQVARTGEELRRKNDELQVLATTDQLTGCANRRALFDHLQRLWSHALRHAETLGCIMIDVDHFKLVNDQHGHAVGDRVLEDVGQRLKEVAREEDIVGRYGGEEFCILVPESDIPGTAALAERVRTAIESTLCGGLTVTASLGVAMLDTRTATPESLIARADDCLYQAKRNGRNRVVCAPPTNLARAA